RRAASRWNEHLVQVRHRAVMEVRRRCPDSVQRACLVAEVSDDELVHVASAQNGGLYSEIQILGHRPIAVLDDPFLLTSWLFVFLLLFRLRRVRWDQEIQFLIFVPTN